jgi:predicted dehydrogenase
MKEAINRRDFLRSTAAVGAGLVLAPKSFGIVAGSKTNDLNVALLGAGAQGRVLMLAATKIPGIRFKAVCDIWTAYNLKRLSGMLRKLGHQHNTYVDYQEMLNKEKDLDVVLIATPDFWHARHAVACLKAGLHVYCEKEMSNTLEGARKIVKAARETGKLLQIGHQRRSNPKYLHSYHKLLKDANILGRITTINGQWNRSARPDLVWPRKWAIDQPTLEKYGFKSMQQFRNWRWYKGLGGGPIVDLGSHQIDVYSWFLGANPKSVIATGGTDYYDKKTHEWYDTVMAVYEYEYQYQKNKKGTVRAFYQAITTNSAWGYHETFMGDQGTLEISESGARGELYREELLDPDWDKWVKKGYLIAPVEPVEEEKEPESEAFLDVRETVTPPAYNIPVVMDKPYHQPHLENFFNAIRDKNVKLNCPPEVGYETAVAVLKVNEAVEAGCRLNFKPEEFEI